LVIGSFNGTKAGGAEYPISNKEYPMTKFAKISEDSWFNEGAEVEGTIGVN
jgi:hypothetical protein